VDRGANGGITGNDAHVLFTHPGQEVNVTGIDNHQINSLKVVDASAKILTQRGEAIGIFRQHAYHGKGQTIHSSGQIEWHKGNIVHDRSLKVGGAQHVRALDGYVLPIDIDNGLPHMSQVPHTQKDFDELPHVIFSSSAEWDPTVLDNKLSSQPNWFDIVKNGTEDGYLRTSLSMLAGTTYTDILTRNPVLVIRRFSTRRSDLFLVSKPTMTTMTTPQ